MPGATIPPPVPPGTPWVCRRIYIPDDSLWFSLVMGALKKLTFYYYWDSSTGDIDGAVEVAQEIYYRYQDNVEGCDMAFDCGALVACLTNPSEALLAAFASAATAAGITPDEAGAESANRANGARPVTVPPDDCDERYYAAIGALVDRLHNDVIDFFQQVEVQTNLQEFVAAMFAAAADQFSVITEFITNVQDNLLELYEAQWTDELRDGIVCALYCEFGTECAGLSLSDILQWYAGQAEITLDDDFWPIMAAIAGGLLPASNGFVYGLHGLALGMAIWGATPINTPLGAWTPDASAAQRYVALVEYAAQTPVSIPAECSCGAPESGCVYEGATLENNAQALYGWGSWSDGAWRTGPPSAGYTAVVLQVNHGDNAATWHRVEVTLDRPLAGLMLQNLRVAQGNVYESWAALTAQSSGAETVLYFEFSDVQFQFPVTQFLIENLTGIVGVTKVRFTDAQNMPTAECT